MQLQFLIAPWYPTKNAAFARGTPQPAARARGRTKFFIKEILFYYSISGF